MDTVPQPLTGATRRTDHPEKGVPAPATAWTGPEDGTLSSMSQTQRDKQMLHDSSHMRSLQSSQSEAERVCGVPGWAGAVGWVCRESRVSGFQEGKLCSWRCWQLHCTGLY